MKRGLARLVWWSTRESPKVVERPLARVEASTLGGALRALAEFFPLGIEYARVGRAVEQTEAIKLELARQIARQRRVRRRLNARIAAIKERSRKTEARIAALAFETATLPGKPTGRC
jgi:hypothetical protein